MKKLPVIVLLLTLLVSTNIYAYPQEPLDSEEIEVFAREVRKDKISKEVQKHTVSIFNIGKSLGFCSGVLIKESRRYSYIITCKHCIGPTEEILVENIQATAIFTTVDDDLALIIVKGKISGKFPARLAITEPNLEDDLVHVGYPSLELFDSIGKLLRTSKDWHWASIKSIGGCSGGGVYNIQGELVGILWGRLRFSNISIYEPLEDIYKFWIKTKEYIK